MDAGAAKTLFLKYDERRDRTAGVGTRTGLVMEVRGNERRMMNDESENIRLTDHRGSLSDTTCDEGFKLVHCRRLPRNIYIILYRGGPRSRTIP